MDCQQSMENYGTPFVAHNGTGAQVEFQQGTASTRLYTNATCHYPHLQLPARVTVGLFWCRRCDITMLPQFPHFTHLHQSPVTKTESPFHCSQ
jgi:hypothetical protein